MKPIATAEDLQKFIDYKFRFPEILEEALRRRAFTNEHKEENFECMDPLATLGDAVLDTIVVARLYRENNRSKEEITKKKIEQVRHERTRTFAEKNNLADYILWGKGEFEEMDTIRKGKAFDAVTEALIGAIFLDAEQRGWNGLKTVQEFLEKRKFFKPDPR